MFRFYMKLKKNHVIRMFHYVKPFGKGLMEFWETIESR